MRARPAGTAPPERDGVRADRARELQLRGQGAGGAAVWDLRVRCSPRLLHLTKISHIVENKNLSMVCYIYFLCGKEVMKSPRQFYEHIPHLKALNIVSWSLKDSDQGHRSLNMTPCNTPLY